MFSLSDRLKAAVNSLEATGSQLQARAISQAQQQPASPSSATASPNPGAASGNKAATSVADATASTTASVPPSSTASPKPDEHEGGSGSAARGAAAGAGAYIASTSALAENALSGLRKSLHFARPSQEGKRPTAADLEGASSTSAKSSSSSHPQELKDMPASPTITPASAGPSSRPGSPSRHLDAGGDGVNGVSARIPRSPGRGHSRTPSALKLVTTQPDLSDPSTYPLPPSPQVGTTPLLSAQQYADPLGASPLLAPADPLSPAVSPSRERQEGLGLGISASILESSGVVGVKEPAELAVDIENLATSSTQEVAEQFNDSLDQYKKIMAQIEAADRIFKELTPLESGISDPEALEGWVRMMNGKVQMITEEMKRLQDKITLQESRMEELRETHRLEGGSQTELISKLRSQLSTAESNLASKATDMMQLSTLRADLQKAQTTAKEEEEKRIKAISLLKTVRAKLVKAEKDKEEVERDRAEERAERSRAAEETERVRAEKEREVNNLRKGFEREMAAARERFEKEIKERKAAWELEMITTKAAHAKELSNKATKVAGLEAIVQELSKTKDEQFHSLQTRQEEVDFARSETETLRNRTTELEFQLREANERIASLEAAGPSADPSAAAGDRGRNGMKAAFLGAGLGLGHPSDPRGGSPSPSRSPSLMAQETPAAELQRMLAEAEARSEAKLSDMRYKIRSLEKERNDLEEEWAAKVQDRVVELEKVRRLVLEKEGEARDQQRSREEDARRLGDVLERQKALERDVKGLQAQLEESREDVATAQDSERLAREELSLIKAQINTVQLQLDEARNRETTLKNNNRTLRDELRKVQSSVQLMEKSRNPGVGYWSAGGANSARATAGASTAPSTPAPNGSAAESVRSGGAGGDAGSAKEREPLGRRSTDSAAVAPAKQDEEEVNLEYLRNVILQFLEHKEMRANLVRVLSVILRFTPQELRRLNAKINA